MIAGSNWEGEHLMRPPVADDFVLQWGPCKGQQIGQVPASHLAWLAAQYWLRDSYPAIYAYVMKHRAKWMGAEIQEADGNDRPIQSFADYLQSVRNRR